MKTKLYILIPFIVTFCISVISGQIPYYQMPDTNAQWKESAFYLAQLPQPTPVYDDYIIFPDGDTLVNGILYTRMFQAGTLSSVTPPVIFYNEYMFAFREDTMQRKVYILPLNNTAEQLLYDFNLSVGDTLPQTYNNNIGGSIYGGNYILAIDSVLVGMNYHKRYLLNTVNLGTGIIDTNYAIIEGVGSTFGFYQVIDPPFESGSQLLCFRHDSDTYPQSNSCPFTISLPEYSSVSEKIQIFPNPLVSDGFIISETIVSDGVLKIYSSVGELVSQYENISGNKIPFHRTNLVTGIYLYTLTDNSKHIRTGRFIVTD